MDRRELTRFGSMMVAAVLGAAVIVGGLTGVEEPGEAIAIGAGSTLELQVTGVAGVPSDAVAVALNMTIVNAQAAGFATVYPCGQPRPESSNLNYAAGQTIPNLVIAKPGTGGKVCIYTFAAVDVLADVSGFFPAGSGFTPVPNPTRVLDTRNGIGAPVALLAAGATLELQVTGVAGVPSNADAVGLNMTIVNAQAPGFATIYPCGQPRPEASNLNFAAGQTIPNLVIAKPGVGGKVCIYSDAVVDVLADVSGFFPAGSEFTPVPNPVRVLDTRNGIGAAVAPVGAGSTLELRVTGVAGVPSDAIAVVLNMTVVNAQAPGFATIYPCGQARPEASNLNYAAGQTIPNLVISKPGAGGKVCIYTFPAVDVLADVSGFFPSGSAFTPVPNPVRVLDTRPRQFSSTTTINLVGQPSSQPVLAGSKVWVIVESGLGAAYRKSLTGVDVESGATTVVPVDVGFRSLAKAGGNLYMVRTGPGTSGLNQIDPDTGVTVESFPSEYQIPDVAAITSDGSNLWIAGDSLLTKIDYVLRFSMASGAFEKVDLPGDIPITSVSGAAYDGRLVWFANYSVAFGFDTSSGSWSSGRITPSQAGLFNASSLLSSGGNLYLVSGGRALTTIDSAASNSEDIALQPSLGGVTSYGMAQIGGALWIGATGDSGSTGKLARINPTTGQTTFYATNGGDPGDVLFDGTNIWTVVTREELDPATGGFRRLRSLLKLEM